jgi:hypothetical protein
MYKKYFIYFLLLFPTVALSFTCSSQPIVTFLLNENNIVVSFKIIDSKITDKLALQSLDIKITKEFNSSQIENTTVKINHPSITSSSFSHLSKDIEWLSILSKGKNSYYFPLCISGLIIENGIISGNTGIDALDNSDTDITIEAFDTALKAYQQGLALADTVCQSSSPYCTKKAKYDIETGILDLPSVSYARRFFNIGSSAYAQAKMKKTSDNPMTFTVIELND